MRDINQLELLTSTQKITKFIENVTKFSVLYNPLAARIRPARRENLYRPIDLLLHGMVEYVQYVNLVRYLGT